MGQCSVRKPEEVPDEVDAVEEVGLPPDSTKASVLRFQKQLFKGCGRPGCTNEHCASNAALANLGPGDALQKALFLVWTKQGKLDPQYRPGPNDPPLLSIPPAPAEALPPAGDLVLDALSAQFLDNIGIETPYQQTVAAFKDAEHNPVDQATAEKLAFFMYEIDSELGAGHEDSMAQLSLMHADGVATPMDVMKSMEWARKAGQSPAAVAAATAKRLEEAYNAGRIEAAAQLAELYRRGWGTDMDYRQCVHWLEMKRMADNPVVIDEPEWMPEDPDAAPSQLTHEQRLAEKKEALHLEALRKTQEEVYRWFTQDILFEQDSTSTNEIHRQLSLMYANGVGVKVNFDRALYHLNEAVNNGLRTILSPEEVVRLEKQADQYQQALRKDKEQRKALLDKKRAEEEERRRQEAADATEWAFDAGDDLDALLGQSGKPEDLAALNWTTPGSGFIPGGGGSITADAKQSGTPGNPDEDKDDEDEDEDVLERKLTLQRLETIKADDELMRTEVDDTSYRLNMGVLRKCLEVAIMYSDGLGVEPSHSQTILWMIRAGYPRFFAQKFTYVRLIERANQDSIAAAYELGLMCLDYVENLTYMLDLGKEKADFQEEAADWFEHAAELGHKSAAFELATCYLDWKGRPVDFKLARKWFLAAGKSREYVRKKVEKKLERMRPSYKRLFLSMDDDNNGHLTLAEFKEFYVACMMAKGLTRKQAISRATGTYQKKQMYVTIFRALDDDDNHGLDFEEVWAHPHTHTAIFPKSGEHYMAAKTYFKKRKKRKAAMLRRNTRGSTSMEYTGDSADYDGIDQSSPAVTSKTPKPRIKTSKTYNVLKSKTPGPPTRKKSRGKKFSGVASRLHSTTASTVGKRTHLIQSKRQAPKLVRPITK